MSMNLDDPKLTAYALGELRGAEETAMAQRVAGSAEAQALVAETRALLETLREEFAHDLAQAEKKPLNILPLPEPSRYWFEEEWMSLGVAAALAVAALVGAVLLSGGRQDSSSIAERRARTAGPPADVMMEASNGEVAGGYDAGGETGENAFVSVAANPVSTFPLVNETQSYDFVRRALEDGKRPPKNTVRLEELVNRFTYNYAPPEGADVFALHLESASCPWQEGHRLVRIGVKAREEGNQPNESSAEAPEAAIEVRFDPAQVDSYRLLGYENRSARAADGGAPRAGAALRAGAAVTALYEIVPLAGASPNENRTLMIVRLRGRRAAASERALVDEGRNFGEASSDFRFAAAVCEFGMILRDSPHKGDGTIAAVIAWAQGATGADETHARAEFVGLIRRAETLAF